MRTALVFPNGFSGLRSEGSVSQVVRLVPFGRGSEGPLVCLSPSPTSTIEDLVQFLFDPIQDVIIEEVIPVVDIESQIHLSGWESPIQEHRGVAFVSKELLIIGFLHDGLAGSDGATQDQAHQLTVCLLYTSPSPRD